MERMVVYLRQNLDWMELNGMPKFVDERIYPLSSRPARHRFRDGDDVLVWSQRSNTRFLYVGILRKADVDRTNLLLRFHRFERFLRPVLICDDGTDNYFKFYAEGKGFLNDFSYIPDAAFERVLADSSRSVTE
jgi:hypothetical protein